jgi:hypothetical protein
MPHGRLVCLLGVAFHEAIQNGVLGKKKGVGGVG